MTFALEDNKKYKSEPERLRFLLFTTIRLADFPLFTIRHYLPIPFGVISMNRYYYLVGAYAPLDLMVTIACLVR